MGRGRERPGPFAGYLGRGRVAAAGAGDRPGRVRTRRGATARRGARRATMTTPLTVGPAPTRPRPTGRTSRRQPTPLRLPTTSETARRWACAVLEVLAGLRSPAQAAQALGV